MAKMIPPVISSRTPSPGEKDIFARLRDDPNTRDWIVLHSFDVADHPRRLSGEIDFVVLVPEKGVLCVEVKASNSVDRRDGLWFYGRHEHGDPRGPFKQASEAMHRLREGLAKQDWRLSAVPFCSLVIFPYAPFSRTSFEWHSWQLIDSQKYRCKRLGALLESALDSFRGHLASCSSAKWFKEAEKHPTPDECERICSLLRGDFEFRESPKSWAGRLKAEVLQYTTEQYKVLDYLEVNPRAIVSGPAGTGKTVMALESARRASSAGKNCLFICFNNLLGAWLQDETGTASIHVRTIHSLMLEILAEKVPPRAAADYWSALPARAIDSLLDHEGQAPQFDELVIDEAQDVLRGEYLDLLDLLLVGGLAAGRWRSFGDFAGQSLYSAGLTSLHTAMQSRGALVAPLELRVNCRNTPRVADLAERFGSLDPGYSQVLRPDDGVSPSIKFFESDDDLTSAVEQTVAEVSHEGIAIQDMVLLTAPGAPESLGSMTRVTGRRVTDYKLGRRDCLGRCSIGAFKGLEAPAVIVAGVAQLDEQTRANLYVAASRALSRLVIIASRNIEDELLSLYTT